MNRTPAVPIDGKVPDRLAAVPFPFGAVGGSPGLEAERAGRQQVGADPGVPLPDLERFLPGGLPDLLLGVVAQTHVVLVAEVQEIGRLGEPDVHRVGQEVEDELARNTQFPKLPNPLPGPVHDVPVTLLDGRVAPDQARSGVVGLAGQVGGQDGAGCGSQAVPLVLGIGGVAQALPEGVVGVVEGPGELGKGVQVQGLAQVTVPRRIHDQGDSLGIGHLRPRNSQHFPHPLGHQGLVAGGTIHQQRDPRAQLPVELTREPRRPFGIGSGGAGEDPGLRSLLRPEGLLEDDPVLRLQPQQLLHHLFQDDALLQGSVLLLGHAVIAQESQSADGVIEVGEGGHRENIPGHLLGLLPGLLPVDLPPPSPGRKALVVLRLRQGDQGPGQLPVGGYLQVHRPAVDLQGLSLQRRDGAASRLHLHVSLAHLLRVVERVAVQEGPDELPGDVAQDELVVGVLQGGVVTGRYRSLARPSRRRSLLLLLFGGKALGARHVVLGDDSRGGIAGPGGGHRVVQGAPEGPGDGDDRLGGEESLGPPAQWGAPRFEEEADYRAGPHRAQDPVTLPPGAGLSDGTQVPSDAFLSMRLPPRRAKMPPEAYGFGRLRRSPCPG